MSWLFKSGWTLLWGFIYLLASIGALCAIGLTLLCMDVLHLEHVASLIVLLQNGASWIAGISGTTILCVLSRYGLPAYAEYRKAEKRRYREELKAELRG